MKFGLALLVLVIPFPAAAQTLPPLTPQERQACICVQACVFRGLTPGPTLNLPTGRSCGWIADEVIYDNMADCSCGPPTRQRRLQERYGRGR